MKKIQVDKIGLASLALLGLLILSAIYPIAPDETKAADCQPGDPVPCATTQAETNVGVEVASSVSLAIEQKSLEIDVIPKAHNSLATGTTELTVATNNPNGYTLYLQAAKTDAEGQASLTSSKTEDKILPVQGAVDTTEFLEQANTWGYNLDGSKYQGVTVTNTELKKVNATSFNDKYELGFGVVVNTAIETGYYSNAVVVSVVANPITLKTLSDLYYMQDMDGTRNTDGSTATSSKICEQSAEGETKQLVDARDGKKYWVAKLKDGNCWMTQNLALDLETAKTYTPIDTDLAGSWAPDYSTDMSNNFAESGASDTGRSWNIGNYVLATPQRGAVCETITNKQSVRGCKDLADVSNLQPTLQDTVNGTWDGYTGPLSINATDGTYNSHYSIGNYYQYRAATAGTSENAMSAGDIATASICSRGWKLPTQNQYASLLSNYGITTIPTGTAVGGKIYAITLPPLSYVHSGSINTFDGTLSNMGAGGDLWTSETYSNLFVYYLNFNSTDVASSAKYYRNLGFSVRCVAR